MIKKENVIVSQENMERNIFQIKFKERRNL